MRLTHATCTSRRVVTAQYTYKYGRGNYTDRLLFFFYSQYGGGGRYAVGYPVELQEHTADGGLEAQTLGRTLGGRQQDERLQQQEQQRRDRRLRDGAMAEAARANDVRHRPSHRADYRQSDSQSAGGRPSCPEYNAPRNNKKR